MGSYIRDLLDVHGPSALIETKVRGRMLKRALLCSVISALEGVVP